jgi:hypothetical protein
MDFPRFANNAFTGHAGPSGKKSETFRRRTPCATSSDRLDLLSGKKNGCVCLLQCQIFPVMRQCRQNRMIVKPETA